jgi:hypothetical protein
VGFRREVAWPKLARPFLTGVKNEEQRDRGWQDFWAAVEVLIELGLIERVGLLLDGEDDEAEVIHPYGFLGGENPEKQLAQAAHRAGCSLLADWQIQSAKTKGYERLVPVLRHVAHVCMREVYRLKYRPHTSATAAWYAEMQRTAAEYLPRYEAMIEKEKARVSSAA